MSNPVYLKVPINIGEQTCMGVDISKPPPYRSGNRFYLIVENIGSAAVLNMTSEHLDAAAHGWKLDEDYFHTPILEDGKVWISLWEEDDHHWCLITDGRIPAEWYRENLLWFGRDPSLELARLIYESHGGDTHGELERWTDPKSYWQKRGWEYTEGSTILKQTVLSESRCLNTKWVCDETLSVVLDSAVSRNTSP